MNILQPNILPLGQLVATPGAMEVINTENIRLPDLLKRHQSGDWGDVGREDWEANDAALKYGDRVLSAYRIQKNRFWIITEADRSTTTVLLPEEY